MSMKYKFGLTTILSLFLIFLLIGCGAPTATSQAPSTSAPAPTTSTTAAATQAPTTSAASSTSTAAPTTTSAAPEPQGELIAAMQSFGNENWLPWRDPAASHLHDLVYDLLIYWDTPSRKFIPGLAVSWENSADGMTLTYKLRQGIQFQDGWGEVTSADVKYNFEMQSSKLSVGKVSQTRRIASMDTPDLYTLVVHFKDPYPTFWVDLSLGSSGVCQGILSKKYIDTVGEDAASEKPIGTGPYKMIEGHLGDYYKFEALDSHWRVVPEFKTLTVRLIPEVSTTVAGLKNKEIDLAQVTMEQIEDLKAAGVALEVTQYGGSVLLVRWGGMVISADKRYDANYHNQDPWSDTRVRKAMALAIDRQAICKAIYAGYAFPASVPIYSLNMDQYQYPYDPEAARQLLKEAGYPSGFSFRAISYTFPGTPETGRIMEALAGYWQEIGLKPEISIINYAAYYTKNTVPCKTAGDISIISMGVTAEMLTKAENFFFPNATDVVFQDEGSYAVYKDNPKATMDERVALVDKLNEYYFENVGPLPIIKVGFCYAWNSDKILPWPHYDSTAPEYYEYVRHVQPLNTFRLFDPYPGR